MIFVFLYATMFTGCDNKGTPQVIVIKTAETLNIDDTGIELPEIKLKYDNGTEKTAAAGDLWFVAVNTFVQDGKVYVKQSAPFIFEDEMQIIYRSNENIKTTLNIVKEYIPLDSITLSAADNATTCKQGETLQLNVTYEPTNAGDKAVVYEIIQGGEYAVIDNNGLLTMNEDAAVNSVIQIKATANHKNLPTGIEDDIDISNIIHITVMKSYEIITVLPATESVYVPDKKDFAFYGYYTGKNGTGIQYFDYKGRLAAAITEEIKLYAYWLSIVQEITIFSGNVRVNNWLRSEWKRITLCLALLKEIGYKNVSFNWQIFWAENDDGPDCTANVVLDNQDINGYRDADWVYYYGSVNVGAGWKWAVLKFNSGIDTVISRPYVSGALGYSKRDKGSYYDISDTSTLTVTVTKN